MPEIKHYVVHQTRRVEVSANSAPDAVLIAEAAFKNGQNSDNGVKDGPEGVWGNTRNEVEEVSIIVKMEDA